MVALVTGVNLLILWSLDYLPFMDHPSHLFRYFAFVHLDDPSFGFSELYRRQYYVPYLGGGELITIFLAKLGLEIRTASKIFYSLYIIGLPASAVYFLDKVNPGNRIYALAAALITFNLSVLLGNENFFFSIPIFLLAVGFWFSRIDDHGLGALAGKASLAAAVFLAHGYTFFLFILTCGWAVLLSKTAWKMLSRLKPIPD